MATVRRASRLLLRTAYLVEVLTRLNAVSCSGLNKRHSQGQLIGLASMRERAESLGGDFLESTPGNGTRVVVSVPFYTALKGNARAPVATTSFDDHALSARGWLACSSIRRLRRGRRSCRRMNGVDTHAGASTGPDARGHRYATALAAGGLSGRDSTSGQSPAGK